MRVNRIQGLKSEICLALHYPRWSGLDPLKGCSTVSIPRTRINGNTPIAMAPFDNVEVVTAPYVLDVFGFEPPSPWPGPRVRTMGIAGGGGSSLCTTPALNVMRVVTKRNGSVSTGFSDRRTHSPLKSSETRSTHNLEGRWGRGGGSEPLLLEILIDEKLRLRTGFLLPSFRWFESFA